MTALDLRVPFTACQEAFGLPGTVTRPAPDDTPIETTVVWMPTRSEDIPGDAQFTRRDPIRVLAIGLADVPTVPRGSTIRAAEVLDGTERTWKVDSTDRVEHDHVRVIVVAVPVEP